MFWKFSPKNAKLGASTICGREDSAVERVAYSKGLLTFYAILRHSMVFL